MGWIEEDDVANGISQFSGSIVGMRRARQVWLGGKVTIRGNLDEYIGAI